MDTGFHGWSDAALDFYRRLEADNTKAFWSAHRATYEGEVRAPFEALADVVADEFGPLHVARPYRDLRFSRDKTPYKTRCYGIVRRPSGESFYVELSAGGLVAGSGYWMMARDQLARYRAAVDRDETGEALAGIVAALRAQGLVIEGQSLRSAPRGYRRDHPRIALLRHRSLAALRSFEPSAWLHTADAATRILDVWRAAAPANAWLVAHVGPSTEATPPRSRRPA